MKSIHARRSPSLPALFALAVACASPLAARDDAAALAKQLANPVAALISVPLQLNYDSGFGPDGDGDKWLLNIQPVVPISIGENWNLISRTILPVVSQYDLFPDAGSQSGIGDIVQSGFFSPKAPTASGWICGVGPVFLLPTGSDDLLTADKWGAGPTAVVLRQTGPWTYGALGNHLWSFAGDDARGDVSATFLQPFLVYGTPTGWTYSMNSESTYDWEGEQASVPVNVAVSKVTKIGGQLVSLAGGLRYWVDGPENGPDGLAYRFTVTLLFPK